jgi:hypothetical protein
MGLLRRRRPRAPGTEPGRSLTELRERGTWVHVEERDQPPRPGRKEPDLQVAWWWHRGDRTVVLGRPVVSVLAPAGVEPRPLRFLGASQVLTVGLGSPAPGEVRRARGVDLVLDPHVPAWTAAPAPAPETPPALAPLLGSTVEFRVEGGDTVDHGGVLQREDTEGMPVRRGRLEAAVAGAGHVVVVLDDLTVAIVHTPCSYGVGEDCTVRVAGDLGRVVLDVAEPGPDVHVARDAALLVRPLPESPTSEGARA